MFHWDEGLDQSAALSLRSDYQYTTGLITALADQSTIITTPENLIGQGVVVTQCFVNLGEVAHAANRRGCLIAKVGGACVQDVRCGDSIITLVSVCANVVRHERRMSVKWLADLSLRG